MYATIHNSIKVGAEAAINVVLSIRLVFKDVKITRNTGGHCHKSFILVLELLKEQVVIQTLNPRKGTCTLQA